MDISQQIWQDDNPESVMARGFYLQSCFQQAGLKAAKENLLWPPPPPQSSQHKNLKGAPAVTRALQLVMLSSEQGR